MNIFLAFFVLLLLLAESTPKAAASIPLIGETLCFPWPQTVQAKLSSAIGLAYTKLGEDSVDTDCHGSETCHAGSVPVVPSVPVIPSVGIVLFMTDPTFSVR